MTSEPMRIAAIDIGTVTTRLLVADVTRECVIADVERSTDITHLGAGLAETGRLAPESMRAVADVIAGYAQRILALDVEATMAVATSASRDAANSDEFLAMLEAAGVRPEIIPGEREAALAFAGATFGESGERLLVVDVGGGSTELVLGNVSSEGEVDIERARSIDIGSRRLTDMFIASDPPSRAELDSARAFAAQELSAYFDGLDGRPSKMIAVAGSATTLVTVLDETDMYNPEAVQGRVVSGADVEGLLEQFASVPLEERRRIPGLHPERAPVIVAGTLILGTALALAGLDSTVVSDRDILYGMVLDVYRRAQ